MSTISGADKESGAPQAKAISNNPAREASPVEVATWRSFQEGANLTMFWNSPIVYKPLIFIIVLSAATVQCR